jgi:hypothetical protein
MRIMILAVAAILSFGGLPTYADSGDDGGIISNTYFNELPGVIAAAAGQRSYWIALNGVTANQRNAPYIAYKADSPAPRR